MNLLMRKNGSNRLNKNSVFFWGIGVVLFMLAIFFRVINLRDYPGWYSDEGNHIDLAENWVNCDWENYGVVGAPFIQRPPFFMYVLSLGIKLFGVDILVSRYIAVIANIICVLMIFYLSKRALGKKVAVVTLILMAFAPWIVAYARFGLTYNLMALFFLLSLLGTYLYADKKSNLWLIITSVSSGIAFSTDFLGIIALITVISFFLFTDPSKIGYVFLIFFSTVFIIFIPVILRNSNLFFVDFWSTVISRGSVKATQIPLLSILLNYTELLRRESWILIGLTGLFLVNDHRLRNILLCSVGFTIILVTRTYAPVGRGLHYLMFLFPVFALGISVFMVRAASFIRNQFLEQVTNRLRLISKTRFKIKTNNYMSLIISFSIVFSPIIWMIFGTYAMTIYGSDYLFTGNDNLDLVDVSQANQVRAYLSENVSDEDVVFGSPALIWGLKTMKRSDFLTALIYNDKAHLNFITIDRTRFRNDLSLGKTRFVIIDPLAENFAPLVLEGMDQWLLQFHQWPIVFSTKEMSIYENPLFEIN